MSGANVSYAEIMAVYDKAFDLAEVKPEPVPEAHAPAMTITDKHLRLLEHHFIVDALPHEAIRCRTRRGWMLPRRACGFAWTTGSNQDER